MAMGARMASVEIPSNLLEFVRSEMGTWSPPLLIDQAWVDDYTRVTRDNNPIHKAGWHSELFKGPIVPALMPLSIADSLFEGGIRGIFPGYMVIFRSIQEFRPKRKIDIGQQVQLRYRVTEITSDPGGIYTCIEIEVGIAFPVKTACYGTMTFYLREE